MRIFRTVSNKSSDSFRVHVAELVFNVEVDKDYYHKLTGEKITPKQLVQTAFEFLLNREPATAILSQFNLKRINDYFPDFEDYVRRSV